MPSTSTPPTPVSSLLLDPRNTITEDAFRLDPALLGTPLARPWRRGAAMAIDGVLVAILANAPSVLFGLAAALVLFRASARGSGGGYLRRSVRLTLRFWGAVVLFAIVISLWGRVGGIRSSLLGGEEPPRAGRTERPPPPPGLITGVTGLSVAADAIALTRAEDEAEARERAERLVGVMRTQGMDESEIREVVEGLRSTAGRPWVGAVADSILGSLDQLPAATEAPDSLAVRLAEALAAGDTTRAAGLRRELALTLAADTLRELDERLRAAAAREESLEDTIEAAREGGGMISALRSFADDLGLGFGWTGLYFTACLALWGGYTPGKRLLGIRVIRLDGRPVGWWSAFERFGGYAAALATGLLGFFQIFWDRNRQGIHDKIAETVVVKT